MLRPLDTAINIASIEKASDNDPFSMVYPGQTGGASASGKSRRKSHETGKLLVDHAMRQLATEQLRRPSLAPVIEYGSVASGAEAHAIATRLSRGLAEVINTGEAMTNALTSANVSAGGFAVGTAGFSFAHPSITITKLVFKLEGKGASDTEQKAALRLFSITIASAPAAK